MMSDLRTILERGVGGTTPPPDGFERMLRRRDRKRRNQRIAAGVVGIAVFVAAIWIVTSGGVFDRSETPAATGPAETVPAPAPAPAAPDVVKQGTCSDGARWRLELTDLGPGEGIEVRFEVHDSPPGHLWHIRMWRDREVIGADWREIWLGARLRARVASDSGDFAVVRLTGRSFGWRVEAIDSATGQHCRAARGFL
jgi:hypothetical protein